MTRLYTSVYDVSVPTVFFPLHDNELLSTIKIYHYS